MRNYRVISKNNLSNIDKKKLIKFRTESDSNGTFCEKNRNSSIDLIPLDGIRSIGEEINLINIYHIP